MAQRHDHSQKWERQQIPYPLFGTVDIEVDIERYQETFEAVYLYEGLLVDRENVLRTLPEREILAMLALEMSAISEAIQTQKTASRRAVFARPEYIKR